MLCLIHTLKWINECICAESWDIVESIYDHNTFRLPRVIVLDWKLVLWLITNQETNMTCICFHMHLIVIVTAILCFCPRVWITHYICSCFRSLFWWRYRYTDDCVTTHFFTFPYLWRVVDYHFTTYTYTCIWLRYDYMWYFDIIRCQGISSPICVRLKQDLVQV